MAKNKKTKPEVKVEKDKLSKSDLKITRLFEPNYDPTEELDELLSSFGY